MTMTRRFSKPKSKLPFLHTQDFEDEAALLLAEYGTQHGQVTVPPIPVESAPIGTAKVTVQLKNGEHCWEAVYSAPYKKNGPNASGSTRTLKDKADP